MADDREQWTWLDNLTGMPGEDELATPVAVSLTLPETVTIGPGDVAPMDWSDTIAAEKAQNERQRDD